MKEIKKIFVTEEVLKKHPLLKGVIVKTYPGVEIVSEQSIHYFLRDTAKRNDCVAVVADEKLCPVDIFSDINGFYRRLKKKMSLVVLIKPEIADDDIAFDETISSFMEIRMKKAWFGKSKFGIGYFKRLVEVTVPESSSK